jgi:hypothetical protein
MKATCTVHTGSTQQRRGPGARVRMTSILEAVKAQQHSRTFSLSLSLDFEPQSRFKDETHGAESS